MVLGRLGADVEPFGDLGVGQPLREQGQNFPLAVSEVERGSVLQAAHWTGCRGQIGGDCGAAGDGLRDVVRAWTSRRTPVPRNNSRAHATASRTSAKVAWQEACATRLAQHRHRPE